MRARANLREQRAKKSFMVYRQSIGLNNYDKKKNKKIDRLTVISHNIQIIQALSSFYRTFCQRNEGLYLDLLVRLPLGCILQYEVIRRWGE